MWSCSNCQVYIAPWIKKTQWLEIEPTVPQVRWGTDNGTARYLAAVKGQWKHKDGQTDYSLEHHIDGALAEKVLGDLLGYEPHPPLSGIGKADLAGIYEVRCTRIMKDNIKSVWNSIGLLVHGRENPDWIAVCCAISNSDNRLHYRGWIRVRDAMTEENAERANQDTKNTRGGYKVALADLRPMDTLPPPPSEL